MVKGPGPRPLRPFLLEPHVRGVPASVARLEPNLNEFYTRTFPLLVPLGPFFGLLARRRDGPGGDVVRLTFRRRATEAGTPLT